jgi:hypothetical protein
VHVAHLRCAGPAHASRRHLPWRNSPRRGCPAETAAGIPDGQGPLGAPSGLAPRTPAPRRTARYSAESFASSGPGAAAAAPLSTKLLSLLHDALGPSVLADLQRKLERLHAAVLTPGALLLLRKGRKCAAARRGAHAVRCTQCVCGAARGPPFNRWRGTACWTRPRRAAHVTLTRRDARPGGAAAARLTEQVLDRCQLKRVRARVLRVDLRHVCKHLQRWGLLGKEFGLPDLAPVAVFAKQQHADPHRRAAGALQRGSRAARIAARRGAAPAGRETTARLHEKRRAARPNGARAPRIARAAGLRCTPGRWCSTTTRPSACCWAPRTSPRARASSRRGRRRLRTRWASSWTPCTGARACWWTRRRREGRAAPHARLVEPRAARSVMGPDCAARPPASFLGAPGPL